MILFDNIVFGPVNSRRLGISLGINLLPVNCKFCNFNCIYCECGLSENTEKTSKLLPSCSSVNEALALKLKQMKDEDKKLDAITFAGNGEPTIHPEFSCVIDNTIELRDKYFPGAAITVLSNATMLHKESVINALKKIEKCYLKIDSAIENTLRKMNRPAPNFSLEKVVDNLEKFNGGFILQTMFTRGKVDDEMVDNTTEPELNAWLKIIEAVKPKLVSIYTIQRIPPYKSLELISGEELEKIADKVRAIGVHVEVAK